MELDIHFKALSPFSPFFTWQVGRAAPRAPKCVACKELQPKYNPKYEKIKNKNDFGGCNFLRIKGLCLTPW